MNYYLAWKDSENILETDFNLYETKKEVFADAKSIKEMTDLFVLKRNNYKSLDKIRSKIENERNINDLITKLELQGMTVDKNVNIAKYIKKYEKLQKLKTVFKDCKENNESTYYKEQADTIIECIERMSNKVEKDFTNEMAYLFNY